ncbi:MAG: branched-chain amino acid ABC transporter permease [Acidobacteriota bacterium]
MPAQLALDGVISGSIYALVALGFVLIYSTARFFHFAHGITFTAGAYGSFLLYHVLGVPLLAAVPIVLLSSALLGALFDIVIYQPLRKRRASPLVLLVVSLGLYIVLQNAISLAFGDAARRMSGYRVQEGMHVFGGRITSVQALTAGVTFVLVVVVSVGLQRTRVGMVIRAVANDPDLATVRGINNAAVVSGVFAVGSLLAAIAGVLAAMDVGMVPTMGMRILMMAIVAVVIGGLYSPLGAAVGGMVLGLAQQFGVWKLGSEWQDAIAFAILVGFLVLRPQGLWGRPPRKTLV